MFQRATGGQVLPCQDFAMHEEVIVEYDRGIGHQEWLFFWFFPGIFGYALDQELIGRFHGKFALTGRKFVPFIMDEGAAGVNLHLAALRRVSTALFLELGPGGAVAALLMNRKGFGGDPFSVEKYAKGT